MTLDKPVELTAADVGLEERPVELTAADVGGPDEEPVRLTAADVEEPVQLTAADVGGRSAAGRIAGEVKGQAAEIARQGAVGVARDLPRMAWNTAAALLPGETPSAENPQGTGAAGFAGQVVEEIASAEEKAAWDDPAKKGWAGVPGMAARSLAPNLLVGVATGGAGVAAMPFLYGGSRAQEVFTRLRDKAQERGEEFDEAGARLNAAAAGGLEGGLEYVSNLVGMNRQIRELMRPGAKAAAGTAAKGIAAGLRRLAGTMLKEGGTELIQEGGGELHEQLIGISDSLEKRPETLAEVDWDAVWERAKYAAAAGALSSGAVGAVQNAATRVNERRAARGARTGRGAFNAEAQRRGDAAADTGSAEGLASQAEPWEDAQEGKDEGGGLKYEDQQAGAAGAQPAAGEQDTGGGAAAAAAAPDAAEQAVDPETAEAAQGAAEKAKREDRDAWIKANTGKGANVSDELQRDNPVAARVLELGGIRLDGTEEDRAIPLAFRSATGQRLDQMLTELQADQKTGGMVADWTTDDLREALQGNTRKAARTARERPASPDEREWLKSGSVTVGQENLALGFTFTVKGIGYEVADADDAGYVLRQTDGAAAGREYRLDHGGMFTIDKESLRSANGRKIAKMAVRARPEDLARFGQAAAERDAAARAEAEALGLTVEEEVGGRRAEVGEDEDLPFREAAAGRPARDAEYLAAVERGDMKTAQRMVDEAAKAEGYTIQAWHGTEKAFNRFKHSLTGSHWFASNEKLAKNYGKTTLRVFLKLSNPFRDERAIGVGWDGGFRAGTGAVFQRRGSLNNFLKQQSEAQSFVRENFGNEDAGEFFKNGFGANATNAHAIIRNIRDGETVKDFMDRVKSEDVYEEIYAVVDAADIKSADAVTYDDAGNVIPLSERFNDDEDDIRYREAAGVPSPGPSPTVPAAGLRSLTSALRPPSTGLRIIRRGYDAERGAADDPAYSRFGQYPMDLPELVELAEDLLDGKTPRVVKRVNPKGTALGSVRFAQERSEGGAPVYGRPETIKLLAANYKLVSDDEEAEWRAQADAKFGAGTEEAKAAFDETYLAELKERMKKGPRLAMAVIAHEIGHVADQMTRYGLAKIDRSVGKNRLNLVGRVAGMLAYTRDILAKEPDGRTLTAEEVRALQGQARRNARPDARGKELWRAVANVWGDILTARPELKGEVDAKDLQAALEEARDRLPVLSEWFGITSFQEQTRMVREALEAFANPGDGSGQRRRMGAAWFRREFVALLERERQAHLGQMYSELEGLIAWWNNGERSMMPAYFERPSEMFAEAFGAFLNNPKAVQLRAPTFYTTLMAHMDGRPQLAQWYDGFNAAMQGGEGNVTAHRHYRAHEMFSEETRRERRQVYDAARRATGKRTAWDAAKFTGVSKSMPIRAVVRAAETLGLKGIADGASAMADRIENLRGLEELYRTMNLEIGKILDEGDLDVADFDTWALYDMVERSPAYVDKANPRGLHPAAAKELKANYRNTLGPQKAETLERAVAKAQDIWQREIVDRLEQWGGLAPETLAYIRKNPVYFTLQVGLDEAETRQWQKALQSQDTEAITAMAQRSVEMHDVGGRRVGPEIVARKGTHRPAVSLLGATMLKGQALLNAAAHNEMQRQLHGLLTAVNDPLFTPVPEGHTARDTASQLVCKFRENAVVDGKPVNREVQFYAPKFVGHFARGDNPTSNLNRWVQGTKFYAAHRALKMFQTILSAKFISTQPMSDRKAWNTQMPGVRTPLGNIARGSVIGGLAQAVPASTWFLPAGVFPAGSRERLMKPMREVARAYYRTGKVDPQLRRLIERGMYDLGGAWQGMMGDNPHPGEIVGGGPLSEQPRSFKPYAQDLSAFAKAWQRLESVPAFGALFRGAGAAVQHAQEAMYDETLANKLAGMTYLDEKYPDMPERQKREWVLKAAGNPNFASRAGADPLIDSLGWAFYNPAKEGWRGAWHAAANDPKGFAVRAAYYNLLPNLIAKGAKYGVLTALAGLIIPPGDTPEEEEKRTALLRGFANWCRLYGRISSYYGRRHVAVPLMPVGTDSALIVTIPQAQSFSPLNSLINIGIDEAAQAAGLAPDDDKLIEKAVNAVTGELQGVPTLLGTSRGMLQQTLGPALALMFTDQTNVYDPFYGRMTLDQDEETLMKGGKFTARALPAWGKIMKGSWNSAFGSMVARFDTKTPRADATQKSGLQKILTSPGIGTLIGGWLRVTGGGEYESIQELFAPEAAERARQTIMARRAAVETINSKDGSFPGWAAERLENDPGFRKAYNRFRLRSEIYEGLTPAEKVMVNRSNPRWKREIIINRTLDNKR